MRKLHNSRATAPRPVVSIVTPAYHEEQNLPVFYERISTEAEKWNVPWEWIVVDDHSKDGTFQTITELARKDPRIRGFRLSRNFGAHHASYCGLMHARGKCAVMMASDLQDPPEVLGEMIRAWAKETHVVWGCREVSPGGNWLRRLASRLFSWVQSNILGLKGFPPKGADFVLIDKIVLRELRQLRASDMDLLSTIFWMGFKQAFLYYKKSERVHGESGWTLRKKLRHFAISIVSFTGLPLRLMSLTGFLVSSVGLSYAVFVGIAAMRGTTPTGWASLMVVSLVMSGMLMIMMGVLGEYLWYCLKQARGRPAYLIEARTRVEAKIVTPVGVLEKARVGGRG